MAVEGIFALDSYLEVMLKKSAVGTLSRLSLYLGVFFGALVDKVNEVEPRPLRAGSWPTDIKLCLLSNAKALVDQST